MGHRTQLIVHTATRGASDTATHYIAVHLVKALLMASAVAASSCFACDEMWSRGLGMQIFGSHEPLVKMTGGG